MMKRFILSILAVLTISTPMLMPAAVYAQSEKGLCEGANLQVNADSNANCNIGGDNGKGATDRVNQTLKLAINILSLIVGVAAVIMIIIGGLKYIMSGGDSTSIQGAKNTIIYALVGLVVVALAQAIVRFVLTRVPT